MAFEVFQNGTALTAEKLNDLLMEQAVITFANASERDNAIPLPQAGMHCYLVSTGQTLKYTGSKWVELLPGEVSGLTARTTLVCTSTTRPSHAAGRMIYETDTKRTYISDGTAWTQKQPTQIAVKDQLVGNIPVGLNAITVTIPNGRSMPSVAYVVNVTAHELASNWGGALFTTHEAVSVSATQFKVRVNNGYSTPLGCHLDYVLTEITG